VPGLSTNTICFNGPHLCVVKPQLPQRITEDNPSRHGRRDSGAGPVFAEDGGINTTCYDEGWRADQEMKLFNGLGR